MRIATVLSALNPVSGGLRDLFRGFDPRPEPEIDDDLDAEFSFHLDQLERELISGGDEPAAARRHAIERFGDVNRLKSECRTIALKERIMLQKVNFVLMLVLTSVVVILSVQVFITQRATAVSIRAIAERLASDQQGPTDQPRANSSVLGVVYIDGEVDRPGVYNLPRNDRLTLQRLIAAAGGRRPEAVKATLIRDTTEGRIETNVDLTKVPGVGDDPVLQNGDHIVVTGKPSEANAVPKLKILPSKRTIDIRWNDRDPATVELPETFVLTFADFARQQLPQEGTVAFMSLFRNRGMEQTADLIALPEGLINESRMANKPLQQGDLIDILVLEGTRDDVEALRDQHTYFVRVSGDVQLPGSRRINGQEAMLSDVILAAQPIVVEGEYPTWVYLRLAADSRGDWIAYPGSDVFGLSPKPIAVHANDQIRVSFKPLHDTSTAAAGSDGG